MIGVIEQVLQVLRMEDPPDGVLVLALSTLRNLTGSPDNMSQSSHRVRFQPDWTLNIRKTVVSGCLVYVSDLFARGASVDVQSCAAWVLANVSRGEFYENYRLVLALEGVLETAVSCIGVLAPPDLQQAALGLLSELLRADHARTALCELCGPDSARQVVQLFSVLITSDHMLV